MPAKALVQIEMLDSTTNCNIQIADWISGALARNMEGKNLGNECLQLIKNNIIGEGKELFKKPWTEDLENQKTQGNP